MHLVSWGAAGDRADMDDSVQTVGIIGAGVMGRSITAQVLRSGLKVRLFDSNSDASAAAAERIASQGGTAVAVASSLADVAGCDLFIEAVVENRAVKRRVLSQLSSSNPSALIATNTSSLSIGELAESVQDAARFCGLHFCHPVELCPLVEVVPSPATTQDTLRQAAGFVQQLEMRPLLTHDAPGFAVNRLLLPYLDAAVDLVRGGVVWSRIEAAAVGFGMRLGPLSQMDEIGIDVILRAAAAFHRGNPVIPPQSELLLAMYQAGRLGRKSGRGFLKYTSAHPEPDPSAIDLAAGFQSARVDATDKDLALRLFIPMLWAACDLLARQIIPDTDSVRMALSAGLACRGQAEDLSDWGRGLGPAAIRHWLQRLGLPDVPPASLDQLLHG